MNIKKYKTGRGGGRSSRLSLAVFTRLTDRLIGKMKENQPIQLFAFR